jgi:outer membrane lipoprotein-sorting protein
MKVYYILVLIALLFIYSPAANAQEPTATELLSLMEDAMTAESMQATIVQTIETSSGGTRDLTYVSFSGNFGERSLMRYSAPSRVKNEAFLMLNNADDIWAFFARTRRIRKLASHARKKKLMGSDFTYEDMGGGKRYMKEYAPERLPDQKLNDEKCYVLKLTPKSDEDATYEKMICYFRISDYYPLKIDYYEKKDELLKILYLQDIQIVEKRPTAMKMVMHNKKDDTRTIMTIKDITYDVAFDDNFFTERNLKP